MHTVGFPRRTGKVSRCAWFRSLGPHRGSPARDFPGQGASRGSSPRSPVVRLPYLEQNVRQTLEIADRGYVLENGRIALAGTGQALLADAHMRAAYLGLDGHRDHRVGLTSS
jgi:hypothetical protein